MSPLDLAAVILIILAPIDWIVSAKQLGVLQLDPHNLSLRSRVYVGFIVSTIATAGALLGVAELTRSALPTTVTTVMVVLVFIAASVPQIEWAVLFLLRRFE